MKKVSKFLYPLLLILFAAGIGCLLVSRHEAPGISLANRTHQGCTAIIDGKVDLNKAAVDELMQLPGIGEALAKKIVKYRTINGSFKSIKELRYIRGISDSVYDQLKDFVTVGGKK